MATFPTPDPAADRDTIAHLRDALDRAGYAEAAVAKLLSLDELPTDRRLKHALPLHLWRTRHPSPLATLVRLFLVGQPVPPDAAGAALHPLALDTAVEWGLLRGGA